MPRIHVLGHLTIDSIEASGLEYESVGGPPAYMGLYLARAGAEPFVTTRIGGDFGESRLSLLKGEGIRIARGSTSCRPTTRFRIKVSREARTRQLTLLARCEDIEASYSSRDFNATIIAPVAGELRPEVITSASRNSGFVYVDPQGYLRSTSLGRVRTRPSRRLLSFIGKADAVKVDLREGEALTGSRERSEIAKSLLAIGVKEVIVTSGGRDARVYFNDRCFAVDVPFSRPADGIGAGDLLGAAYVLSRLRESPAHSLSVAVAAASSLIEMKALAKVPRKNDVESQLARVGAAREI